MDFSKVRLTGDEAHRLYGVLEDARAAAKESPSIAALRALARVAMLLGGHYATGDDVAQEAVDAASRVVALLDRDRDPRAWAEAQLDLAEALRSLSVFPGDRDGMRARIVECVRAALAALPEEERGDLRVRALLAAAAYASTPSECVRLAREAVATVAPYRATLAREAATTLRWKVLADPNAAPCDIEAAFQHEIALFGQDDDEVFQDFVHVQSSYGRWLLAHGEPSRAVAVFRRALATLENGSRALRETKEIVARNLARAEEVADLPIFPKP